MKPELLVVIFGSLAVVLIVWTPVIFAYVYARRKKIGGQFAFSLICGCLCHGFFILLGSIIFLPFGLVAIFLMPEYCQGAVDNLFCEYFYSHSFYSIEELINVVFFSFLIIASFTSPILFNRYFWCKADM